jgi:hypothetical protein
MTQFTVLPVSCKYNTAAPQRNIFGAAARLWKLRLVAAISVLTGAFFIPVSIAATPAAGDAYVYRVVNGYNGETVGQLRHEVTAASTAQGVVANVTMDNPSLGPPRTEMYTTDGQWLRRPLDNHGFNVEYEFAPALPVLTNGKTWSTRVNAKVPSENASRSVRIDGQVLGNERVRVPAGEFDTVKIHRIIYSGDWDYLRSETRIVELDWYAPALGRTVRSETRSGWRQYSCGRSGCDYRGNWNVMELTEAPKAAP